VNAVDARRLWVEALRSGDYEQGIGALNARSDDGVDRFCCFGVACEVAIANGVPVEKKRGSIGDYTYDGHAAFLPRSVLRWLGTDDMPVVTVNAQRHTLVDLNDDGRSFEAIADLIEAQL